MKHVLILRRAWASMLYDGGGRRSRLRAVMHYDGQVGSLLDLRNLDVRFGAVKAVRGIDLRLDEGETLGLVGESGSGKSATALAILGLLPSLARATGQILWHSPHGAIDLLRQPPAALRRLRGREIAMVFQEPMTALNPVMAVGRQVAECLAAHNPSLTRQEVRRRTIDALQSVALPQPDERFGDYPHQFSGGQRQRILIAMALINRPRLLIADEPTTALDVTVQAQILTLLSQLQREHALAMLFISHDLAVVGQVASRVAVMRSGEIVESGPARQILTAPRHAYTCSLLAAVPTLRTDRAQPLAVADPFADR